MLINTSWPIFISKRIFHHKRKRYILGIFAQCYAYLTIWILSSLSLGLKENMVKRVFQRLDEPICQKVHWRDIREKVKS